MEKTTGLKSSRSFFKDEENVPYEFIGTVTSNEKSYIMKNLTGNGEQFKMLSEDEFNKMKSITQGEIFLCIDDKDDQVHADMMRQLGIGYICPFCGGVLHWECDNMASEMGCDGSGYIEIEDEETISRIKEMESEYSRSGLLGYTENIEDENNSYSIQGYYQYMYLIDKEKDKFYQIDDAVVGTYHCSNCGKQFEVRDCLPSEEKDYPYFN